MQALRLDAAECTALSCFIRRSALLALLCTHALLTACGGGDGAAPAQAGNVPTTAASTPSIAITGFTPASTVPGGIVTVTGSALSAVTSVKVGGIDATFRLLSDTTLELTVPLTATTSRIELSAAGRVVLSASDLTVQLVPIVTGVAPTTVVAPGRVTLTGVNLDLVREARLGTLTLNIATRSATSLVLDVPGTAASGTLTLVDTLGATRTVAQPVTVVGQIAISSFAPATIVTGQTLTVDGTNLDRATAVVFANGATADIATRTGTTRITAVVPDTAASGVFRVRGNAGDEALAASALQVIPAIKVDAGAVYRVAAAGANVTIAGTGLTEVTGVRVAGRSRRRSLRRPRRSWCSLCRPDLACGAITLESASQPAVAGWQRRRRQRLRRRSGRRRIRAGAVAGTGGRPAAAGARQGDLGACIRRVIAVECTGAAGAADRLHGCGDPRDHGHDRAGDAAGRIRQYRARQRALRRSAEFQRRTAGGVGARGTVGARRGGPAEAATAHRSCWTRRRRSAARHASRSCSCPWSQALSCRRCRRPPRCSTRSRVASRFRAPISRSRCGRRTRSPV